MIKWSRKTVRKLVRTVTHAEGSPSTIARAVGFGMFVGWFPIFGTHTVLAISGSWLLRVNPALVMAASWINNPFTIVPIFMSGFYVGLAVTGAHVHLDWHSDAATLVTMAKTFIIPFIVGNLILGTAAAVIGYFLTYRAVLRYRASRSASVPALDDETLQEDNTAG